MVFEKQLPRVQLVFKIKTLLVLLVAFFSCLTFAEAEEVQELQQEQLVAPTAETTVMDLLQQMAMAGRERSYKGIFTYEHGGMLKTIEVAHMVREGLEYERLTHLNGPKREVIRHGRSLDCQRRGNMLLRGVGLDIGAFETSRLDDNYKLYIKGNDRVAGRDVIEIHIVPKDKYRYGYSLAVDRETSLLLQSMLIDHRKGKRVLERFQFVSIDVDMLITESDITPTLDDHFVASIDSGSCVGGDEPPSTLRQWRAAWLPPGFVLVGYQPRSEATGEALIYTDGLAVFSIFVDPADRLSLPEVEARRGATLAYMTRKGIDNQNFAICVVGEIPMAVAKQVAHSVSPLQSP